MTKKRPIPPRTCQTRGCWTQGCRARLPRYTSQFFVPMHEWQLSCLLPGWVPWELKAGRRCEQIFIYIPGIAYVLIATLPQILNQMCTWYHFSRIRFLALHLQIPYVEHHTALRGIEQRKGKPQGNQLVLMTTYTRHDMIFKQNDRSRIRLCHMYKTYFVLLVCTRKTLICQHRSCLTDAAGDVSSNPSWAWYPLHPGTSLAHVFT